MREILCAICGGDDRQVVYESTVLARDANRDQIDPYAAHYRINRCLKCDLLYSSPIFDSDEVSALYSKSPHTNVVTGEEENVRRTMELYYRLVRPFLAGRQRILDIGCDIGLLLNAARRDGFQELYGIEPVPTAARIARSVPGAVISSEFYERQVFPEAHFDLITLIHVVDHLVDPAQALGRTWAQLKPGSVILAVVHNSGSLLSRLLGERFPPYNLYHHYFFSPATLRRLFERSKFEVLRLVSTYNCYSMDFLVQRVPGVPAPVREALRGVLGALRLARFPLTVPLGNIGIVARRPHEAR